jgi:hypothetical protein
MISAWPNEWEGGERKRVWSDFRHFSGISVGESEKNKNIEDSPSTS